uniref:Kisspeptin 2 n=1 Tax=Cynoglossus semilaevis TaxID=244447 RepID=A0A3P8WEF6_CYNSE
MIKQRNMRLVALAVVCCLVLGQDGGSSGAVLPQYDSTQRTQETGNLNALNTIMRRVAGRSSGLCFSRGENDERRQLLCNDRRSKFNFNPFGLRFGKRYIYRRAVAKARTNKFSPLSVFSRELEVAT